jgi:hypothetical protein
MATTVYKWVDEQGVTHYSDQPHPEAKTIDVQPVQTYSSPAEASSSADTVSAPAAGPRYVCEVSRPENDEVFLNTHTVSGSLRLEPTPSAGDRVVIALDGKTVEGQSGNTFLLTDLPRGSHTLRAAVYDASGRQLCATPTVTFHVRQPSVQAPVKAVRPKF